jgi:hypothetical protein
MVLWVWIFVRKFGQCHLLAIFHPKKKGWFQQVDVNWGPGYKNLTLNRQFLDLYPSNRIPLQHWSALFLSKMEMVPVFVNDIFLLISDLRYSINEFGVNCTLV